MKGKPEKRRNNGASAAVVLQVRIQPRASKNEVLRMEGGGIKIRLTAPPVDNAANEALVKFLADVLSIAKSQIAIVAGHTAREKAVVVRGLSDEEVMRLLNIQNE